MKYKQLISWDSEKHPELTGKLRTVRENVDVGGFRYKEVYVFESEDAMVEVLGSTVLSGWIQRLNIQVGETIRIKFLGMKKGGKAEYKDFEVSVGIED